MTRPHYILANLGPYEHPAPPISCPGKFGKDNLIMLVDGTNASAGYFLPAMMDDISTSLAIGGFHGEAITLGSARGGNVLSVNGTSATLLQGLSQGVPFSSEVLLFSRNVDSRYEQYGSYREDLETLHVVDPVTPDLRLPVWGSTTANATRSYIYAEVVKAIK